MQYVGVEVVPGERGQRLRPREHWTQSLRKDQDGKK